MYINRDILDILSIFFANFIVIGSIFGYFYRKKSFEYQRLYSISRKMQDELKIKEIELATYKERLEYLKSIKESLNSEFKEIANEVLSTNTKANSEHIKLSIKPFYENLDDFNRQIREFYIDESKERYSLTKEIENLRELNLRLSQDATNLANALKGENKIQGNWGEMILNRVLENSGLVSGREYQTQLQLKGDDGRYYRPDAVIHLPQKRDVIIDSKVSLKSYELYYNDEQDRELHLKDFIRSIKTHISDLSRKSYQNLEGIESLDFVLMFIPIEGAFMTIIKVDREIFEYAYSKNIIVVSPSTLLSVLRVIENGWRFDYQNKNAKLIAKKAQMLYEKFELFVDEMKKIDASLTKARDSYDEAFKKLSTGRGNLLQQSRELKALQSCDTKSDMSVIS